MEWLGEMYLWLCKVEEEISASFHSNLIFKKLLVNYYIIFVGGHAGLHALIIMFLYVPGIIIENFNQYGSENN